MSYRPLVLYDPDSDDSSSDGGSVGGRAHASMGIANDHCRRDSDSDRFSLDSNLMEIISDDEMDDPAVSSKHYNPANFRVEMGKRVGVDSDDDSDGDGEHYGRDKDYGVPARMRASGDIDEHSIGSDDEYQTAHTQNFPKHITRNDAEFDSMIPTGSGGRTTGGAGEPDDAFAEGDTDEQHMAKKASQKARKEGQYKEAERLGEKGTAKGKREVSKKLVADALAKAREAKNPTAKAFLEAKARQLAKGTESGATIKGGKISRAEGNIAGATLSEATRAKGKEVLTKLGKNLATAKGKERGALAEKFDERQKKEVAEAKEIRKTKMAEAGSLAVIKGSGGALQSALRKVDAETDGRGKAVKAMVERLLKAKAFASLVKAVRENKQKNAVAKIVKALKTSVAKTTAEATLIARLIKEKFAGERASAGLPPVPPRVAGNEDRPSVGDPRAGTVASADDPTGASVAPAPPTGKKDVIEDVKLSGGHNVELTKYGSQVKVFVDGTEIKAGKKATEADAGMIEGIIAQIKSQHGATSFSAVRRVLGERAKAIRKALRKSEGGGK